MLFALVLAFQQAGAPSSAPDSTQPRLAPVTVTAERPRSAPPPVAVRQVSAEALQRVQAGTAYDVLRRTAGLEVHEQGQGPGFTSNVVVRGFNSDHSADVLLVVDGVPINSPVHGHVEGFSDWNVLLPLATSSLRVLHGGASPLYGDFSLAGVVEVFTAADAEGTTHQLSTSSFGDARYGIRTGRRGTRGGSMLVLEANRQAGWQPNGDAQLGNAVLRGWRSVAGGRLEGGVQAYASGWDSPGFVSVPRYNLGLFDEAVDTTDGGWSRRVIAHARYARALGARTQLEGSGWYQQSAYEMLLNIPSQNLALRQAQEMDVRRGLGGRLQAVRRLAMGEVVAGVEGRTDASTYEFDATLAGEFVTREHAYDARFASGSGFLRWRTIVGSQFAIDVGGRVDALRYSSLNLLRPTLGERSATRVIATPKLGAQWFAREGLVFRSSLSRGFRGAPGVIADPSRPPFLAWATELGASWRRGTWHADVALFRMDVENERIFNPFALATSSEGESRRQGIATELEWEPTPTLALRLDGTWNHAFFLGTQASDTTLAPPSPDFHDHAVPMQPGDPIPGVSRWHGALTAEQSLGRARLAAAWRVMGPFVPISEPGVETQPASVLDLGLALPIGRWAVDVGVQNVLDLRYVENRASGFITPGRPRVLRVTLRTGAP